LTAENGTALAFGNAMLGGVIAATPRPQRARTHKQVVEAVDSQINRVSRVWIQNMQVLEKQVEIMP